VPVDQKSVPFFKTGNAKCANGLNRDNPEAGA